MADEIDLRSSKPEGALSVRRASALTAVGETSKPTEPTATDYLASGLLVFGLDGSLLRSNKATSEILGISLDGILGARGLEDSLPGIGDTITSLGTSHGRDEDGESLDVIHVDDQASAQGRWIEVQSTLLPGIGDGPGRIVSVIRDVTRQVRTTEELANSNNSLAHLLDNAPLAIMTIGRDQTITSWNATAERVLGWTAEEMVGRPARDLHAAGELDVDQATELLWGGGAITGYHDMVMHKDGHMVHMLSSAVGVAGSSGEIDQVMAYGIDITDKVLAEQQLISSDRRFRRMVDNLSEMVAVVTPDGSVVESTVMGGAKSDQTRNAGALFLSLREVMPFLHPDDRAEANEFLDKVLAEPGVEIRHTFRLQDPFNKWAYMQATAVNHIDDPDIGGIVLTARDVSGHKRNEALLADQAAVLELIARNAPLDEVLDAIVAMFGEHSTGSTSAMLLLEEGRLEVAAGDLPDEIAEALADPDSRERFGVVGGPLTTLEPVIVPSLRDEPSCAGSFELLESCGLKAGWGVPILADREDAGRIALGVFATWFDSARKPTGHERRVAAAAVHLADIAIERHHAQHEMAHAALFDQLTGLPNRRQLLDSLTDALTRADQRGTSVAVMFLDLDRFKLVNDNYGHTVGDQLMAAFGVRLQSLLRPGDMVGRFEGDEFVVILEDIVDELDIRSITNRLEFAMSEPFTIDEGEVILTASTGIAISTGEESAIDLLQNADVALVRAKERGRDTVEMFDDGLRTRARVRLETERDLRQAIEKGELAIFYQPKVDLASGRIMGAEALLRWFHPTQGLVTPAAFIPVAEETGLITRIGRWVVDESIHQARIWSDRKKGDGPMVMAVNLSARQLRAPDLVSDVARSLERHSWEPRHLVLELTESLLIDDADGTINRLQELQDLGVRLAIDDFGTGYSSLSYLDQLPVDIIKIDRAFVGEVNADGSGAAIVTAVIHMAEAFGMTVLAEGVEEKHQLDGLRLLGCKWAQGYYFARPLPSEDLTTLLEQSPVW